MIRVNLGKKKRGGGGGINLKNLNMASLLDNLKIGADGNAKLAEMRKSPILRIVIALLICYIVQGTVDDMRTDDMKKLDVQIAAVEKQVSDVTTKLNQVNGFEKVKKQLEEDEQTVRTKLEVITKLVDDRSSPAKILLQIIQDIPEQVWLSDFDIKNNNIRISGATTDLTSVSDFIKSLTESTMLEGISLRNIEEAVVQGKVAESKPNDPAEIKIQNFEITAKRRVVF